MPDPLVVDAGPDDGDSAFATIDLNRTPLDRSPFAPNPNDHATGGGEVLYQMAFGAKPEDFHPTLQPLAQGYSLLFQPQQAQGPGLLGSLDDIRQATAANGARQTADGGDSGENEQARQSGIDDVAARIRQRDLDYLDRYYDAVANYANQYKVNPALPLGLGIESTFGSGGTYLKTGDAFGMTGGSKAHMTHAASPEENARQLFDLYGRQMYGVGDDAEAFINAMQGRDAKGRSVVGWRVYNSDKPKDWETMTRSGISQMTRDLPIYLPMRKPKAKSRS